MMHHPEDAPRQNSPSLIAATLSLLLIVGSAAALERLDVTATCPATITLPGTPSQQSPQLRRPNGEWETVPTGEHRERAVRVLIPPVAGGLLLLDRPTWMVLQDDAPPVVRAATLNGKPLPLQPDGSLDLGCVTSGIHRLVLTVEDEKNPIGSDVRLEWAEPQTKTEDPIVQMTSETARKARVECVLNCRTAGTFESALIIADQSAMQHQCHVRLRHAVMGISVAEDGQAVRLSNGHQSFLLKPDRSNQLLLPNGVWAKLTTNINGMWLYPRSFEGVETVEDTDSTKTVRVHAATQSIKGKPIEGIGRLEYTLSVRTDTRALMVSTRSVNISDKPAVVYANWGWLPGKSYVLPEGSRKWRGKAADKYFDVGWPGWLWLEPRREGTRGIAWMAPGKFGESRFDTMLLYSEKTTCKPGEGVTIAFAISTTDTPQQAARIYTELVQRGILTRPETTTPDH